ncbi:MAG: formyltransferase family protein [Pseudomonadota bacterium]
MMNRRLLFLCGQKEGLAFRQHAESLAPGIETLWVDNVESLDVVTEENAERTRLLSFLTNVIVPQRILRRLGPTPYNVHPGSSDYPGAHGINFAIWEGADTFGVTAHEMTATVDSGAIVISDTFALPADADALSFGDHVYARAVSVMDRVIRHCVTSDRQMPRDGTRWSTRQCTKRRLDGLLAAAPSLLPADFSRLQRALGPDLWPNDFAKHRHG